jgi:hypothetical protein
VKNARQCDFAHIAVPLSTKNDANIGNRPAKYGESLRCAGRHGVVNVQPRSIERESMEKEAFHASLSD